MDRRPAIPVAVELDVDRVVIDNRTGERLASYEHVYTEYDVGRIRAGYCCAHCGEAQEQAFPVECSACGFPMREKQAQKFAEDFEGYTTIGPARSLAELRAEDEEAKERARRKREGRSGLWIPT